VALRPAAVGVNSICYTSIWTLLHTFTLPLLGNFGLLFGFVVACIHLYFGYLLCRLAQLLAGLVPFHTHIWFTHIWDLCTIHIVILHWDTHTHLICCCLHLGWLSTHLGFPFYTHLHTCPTDYTPRAFGLLVRHLVTFGLHLRLHGYVWFTHTVDGLPLHLHVDTHTHLPRCTLVTLLFTYTFIKHTHYLCSTHVVDFAYTRLFMTHALGSHTTFLVYLLHTLPWFYDWVTHTALLPDIQRCVCGCHLPRLLTLPFGYVALYTRHSVATHLVLDYALLLVTCHCPCLGSTHIYVDVVTFHWMLPTHITTLTCC